MKPVTKTDLICSFDFLKGPYLSRFFLGKLIHIIYCIIAGQNSIEIRWVFFYVNQEVNFSKIISRAKTRQKNSENHYCWEYCISYQFLKSALTTVQRVIKFSSSWEHSCSVIFDGKYGLPWIWKFDEMKCEQV